MKMITAIIRHDRLKALQEALERIGTTRYTLSATLGSGERNKADEEGGLRQHLRLEIAVQDGQEQEVVSAFRDAGTSGARGEGVIFVSQLQRAIKIRTGEESGTLLGDDYLQQPGAAPEWYAGNAKFAEVISAADFTRCGLSKLGQAELDYLDGWLRRFISESV